MKIGIDARMFGAKSTTGIGVYIEELTKKLFQIDQENHYFLFMNEPAFSEYNPPNQRVKKIKVDCSWYSFAEQLKMPKILNSYDLNLVHFPHFNVPILYNKDFVVTIHDITPKFFPGPKVKKSTLRKLAYNLVFNTAVKKSKKILTISNHTKQNIIENFKVNADKIKVIYPGVTKREGEIKTFDYVKNTYSIAKPYIFYVGVWRDHKNLDTLVKAFDIFKDRYNLDYQLVIGGKPDPKYPEIIEAIKKSKHKIDILTPGFIPENDLSTLYANSKLFVLPSFCEGFGLVAIEALSLGVPVVGSQSTSLPEILQDSAIYFNPTSKEELAESIHKVVSDENLAKNLAKNYEKIADKYDWNTCAKQTFKIYQNIFKKY